MAKIYWKDAIPHCQIKEICLPKVQMVDNCENAIVRTFTEMSNVVKPQCCGG